MTTLAPAVAKMILTPAAKRAIAAYRDADDAKREALGRVRGIGRDGKASAAYARTPAYREATGVALTAWRRLWEQDNDRAVDAYTRVRREVGRASLREPGLTWVEIQRRPPLNPPWLRAADLEVQGVVVALMCLGRTGAEGAAFDELTAAWREVGLPLD